MTCCFGEETDSLDAEMVDLVGLEVVDFAFIVSATIHLIKEKKRKMDYNDEGLLKPLIRCFTY